MIHLSPDIPTPFQPPSKPITAADALIVLFNGTPSIGKLVRDFDFSRIDVTDNTRADYLKVALAPAYGTLNNDSVKKMDEQLKVMIAGAVKTIASIPPSERSWDRVVSAMMQCPLIEPAGDAIRRADRLIKSGINVFKFDGSPDAQIVREVQSWFVDLINDLDVLRVTQIDIEVLANIVAWTGATIDSFKTLIYKVEKHEKTLVDIGVLRFPDATNPFFKVYRISLTAWSSSARVLMVQDDGNGITGEFLMRRFKPRSEVISNMRAEALRAAVEEADNMFRPVNSEGRKDWRVRSSA